MEIYNISVKESMQYLKDKLNKHFIELNMLKNGLDLEIKERPAGRLTFLSCALNNGVLSPRSSVWESIRYHAANAVTDTIIENMEEELLKKILRMEYGYFSREEQKRILELANHNLNQDMENDKERNLSRRNLVLFRVLEYLERNKYLNLEGFVRFWLKDYWQVLQEALQKAVDEYLVEREQKEFIRLLRYFLEIQEAKYSAVHIVEKENEKLSLMDEKWRPINYGYLAGMMTVRFQDQINDDDCLLSALITLAPQQVYLHRCNYHEIINTIQQVFQERIVICLGCEKCQDKIKH